MSEPIAPRGKISSEFLVGGSAVLIGVCALAVSLYEASLMREEQRASVIPLVELSRSYNWGPSDDPSQNARLTLQAENVGIGPARIADFKVTVDGVARKSWREAMQALLNTDGPVRYGQSTINGRTIPPDRTVTMFNLGDVELTRDIIEEFERLDFEACFCSIFDECWTTSYRQFGTSDPVESCAISDDSFQE